MVKTAIHEHAKINRTLLTDALSIFGKTLTHRIETRTVDAFGVITGISTSDTSFSGDLQFGLSLDQKFISSGIVEVGDGVLYLHPESLTTLPVPQDQIIDGSNIWEIVSKIEAPELGGDVTFYTFRCKRRINSGDS